MKLSIKPVLNILLLSVALLLGNFNVDAQSYFEGKIIYNITYSDLPDEMKGYESMLPKDIKIFMKGNISRIEQSQMMGNNVVVSDMDNKRGFLEMDVNGQKLRLKMSSDQFEDKTAKDDNIEYVDETKVIAGYTCKKALIKDENGEVEMTVFYTEEIQNKAQLDFVGIKGFPLEYSLQQGKINMIMSAGVVSAEELPDELFKESKGYKDISEEELQKIMSGG